LIGTGQFEILEFQLVPVQLIVRSAQELLYSQWQILHLKLQQWGFVLVIWNVQFLQRLLRLNHLLYPAVPDFVQFLNKVCILNRTWTRILRYLVLLTVF